MPQRNLFEDADDFISRLDALGYVICDKVGGPYVEIGVEELRQYLVGFLANFVMENEIETS